MADSGPLVSIGIPVYNGSKYIIDTLDSINNQMYSNIEVFIVDDGSSDDSYSLCKQWATKSRFRVSVKRNITNLGVTKTCNILLNQSNGKYLQLFAQDDIMLPAKLEHDVEIFEQLHLGVALLYSKVKLINESGKFIEQEYNDRIGFDGVLKQDAFVQLVKSNFIPATTVILRTDIVRKTGGYDESLLFEDWDMWLRLSRDYTIYFSDVTNVQYRIHPDSIMARKGIEYAILKNETNTRMFKKYLGYKREHDKIIYNKLKELSIYSYFLGDKNAPRNLNWYLRNRFDAKIWLYNTMARLGIKHPSQIFR